MISVMHPNGFQGILYGKSSLKILDSEGCEVLHTGFRNPNLNDEKSLYDYLDNFPDFLKTIGREDLL